MTRRSALFWGPPALWLGALLLLGVSDPWGWFWPLLMIWAGAWLVWLPQFVRLTRGGGMEIAPADADEGVEIDLRGAQRGLLTLDMGACTTTLRRGAPPGAGLRLNVGGDLDTRSTLVDGRLVVDLDLGPRMPFLENEWQLLLNESIPWQIKADVGMSSLRLDLRDLSVENLQLEAGMSQIDLTCPAQGESHLRLEVGMSSVTVRIPVSAAAHLTTSGLGIYEVDTAVFLPQDEGIYVHEPESPSGQIHLTIENGLGTVRIVQE